MILIVLPASGRSNEDGAVTAVINGNGVDVIQEEDLWCLTVLYDELLSIDGARSPPCLLPRQAL